MDEEKEEEKEEEDPLALIVAALREATDAAQAAAAAVRAAAANSWESTAAARESTDAARATSAAVESARAEAKNFHNKLSVRVAGLENKVAAFTNKLTSMMAKHLARYGWGLTGVFVGLSVGTFLLLMLATLAQRTHG
jgi:hypothetical protein